MYVLIIGALCAFAAFRAGGPRGLSPRAALACAVAIGAAVVLQLYRATPHLEQYRFALLGLRYAALGPDGRPAGDTLRVSGSYEHADLYVAGAGEAEVAWVRVVGDSTAPALVASAVEDGGAAVLLRRDGLISETIEVLGARPMTPRDTVYLDGAGGLALIAVERRLAGRRVHVIRSSSGREVPLPRTASGWRSRLWNSAPGPLRRTYPLADVLDQLGESGGEDLSSFFFYQDGTLSFADLDSEAALGRGSTVTEDTVWAPALGGVRLTIAGLAYRDYPDMDLRLPERYGVRPLRTGEFRVRGGWADFRLATAEIRSFDRGALEQLSLDHRTPTATCSARDSVYRVHVSPVRQTLARQAVTFSAPPRRFESASQAIVWLPCDFSGGTLRILSPTGLASGAFGVPFTIGDGEREVILRIDTKRTRWIGMLLLLAILAAPAMLFRLVAVPAAIRALAVCATGLVAIRLLLGFSAAVEYPFLDEASQTSLWFAAVLPWAVLMAGVQRGARRPSWYAAAQASYGLCCAVLAGIAFSGGGPKPAVLGLLSIALGFSAFPATARAGRRAWAVITGLVVRMGPLRRARPVRWIALAARRFVSATRRFPGARYGAALLLLRVVLAAAGMPEALSLAGTRVGISVFYTPLSMFLLARVVCRHDRRMVAVVRRGGRPAPALLPSVVADLWLYLGFALVVPALLIADLGLALTTLPGALVLLLLLGDRWFPVSMEGARGAAERVWRRLLAPRVALALPLVVFVLFQVQPRLALSAGDPSQLQFRMQRWDTSELRLLERADPAALQQIGQRGSEALGAMRETMRAYTQGPWFGARYFRGMVSPELRATAAQEHAVSALLVGQWGYFGALGLVLLVAALLAPVSDWWRGATPGARWTETGVLVGLVLLAAGLLVAALLPERLPWAWLPLLIVAVLPALGVLWWNVRTPVRPGLRARVLRPGPTAGALFLLTLCGAGTYMILANYGLVLFTGKNVYGLSLDSIGDLLETLALFAGAAALLSPILSPPPAPEMP